MLDLCHKIGHDLPDGHTIVVRFGYLREIASRVANPRSSSSLYSQPSRCAGSPPSSWRIPWLSRSGSLRLACYGATLTAGTASWLPHTRLHHAMSMSMRQEAILAEHSNTFRLHVTLSHSSPQVLQHPNTLAFIQQTNKCQETPQIQNILGRLQDNVPYRQSYRMPISCPSYTRGML